jgi:hypothetical protein
MKATDVINSYEKFSFDIKMDVEKILGVTLLNTIEKPPVRYDEFSNKKFFIRIRSEYDPQKNVWLTPLEVKYKIFTNKFHKPGNGWRQAGISQYVWPEVVVKVVFFDDEYIILGIKGDELLNISWRNPILQEDGQHSFIDTEI